MLFNPNGAGGHIANIVWTGWGNSTATGIGQAIIPNGSSGTSNTYTFTVAAFDLGTCRNDVGSSPPEYMYQGLEWYYPQRRQRFDPHRYENVCYGTGTRGGGQLLAPPPPTTA
jgi:hypothetical protein